MLFAAFLFTLLYFLFLAGLTAATRGRTSRMRELARAKFFCARFGRLIMSRVDRVLHACQVGTFFSAFGTGVALTLQLDKWYSVDEPSWRGRGLLLYFVSLFVYLGITLPFLHLARAFALARPNRTLCVISVPLLFFTRIFDPLNRVFGAIAFRVGALVGVIPVSERDQPNSSEEIKEIIEKSSKAGKIEEDEGQMIQDVFTFSSTVVREVMTPRNEIIYVDEKISLADLVEVLVKERLSRVLVVGSGLDDVKGVVLGKDLVPYAGRQITQFAIARILRPAYFVPNTKNVDELLTEFRSEGRHFAVVLDEHGGVDGVVTLEDLIEEIVGEIFDEYDSPLEEIEVVKTGSGDLLIDGGTSVDDLNESYGLRLPEGPYDTVAGFIIQQLGRLPVAGEEFRLDGLTFHVESLEDARVAQIRVRRQRDNPPPAKEPAAS